MHPRTPRALRCLTPRAKVPTLAAPAVAVMTSLEPQPPPVDRKADTVTDIPAVVPSEAMVDATVLVVVYAQDVRDLCRRVVLDAARGLYTVGRGEDALIPLDSPWVSRRHACFELRKNTWWVVDMGSHNGTWVNDRRVEAAVLCAGDLIRIGRTVFKYLDGRDAEAMYLATIRTAMRTDGLTHALTHAAFREALATEVTRSRRYDRPLSLLMIDLDYFKTVNDTLGHLAGDQALQQFANVIRGRIRQGEDFGRLGGEEFGVLLPETGLAGATVLAGDLQRRVAEHSFVYDGNVVTFTASFGVATLTRDMANAEALLERADRMLYAAKHAGRNQLVVDSAETPR